MRIIVPIAAMTQAAQQSAAAGFDRHATLYAPGLRLVLPWWPTTIEHGNLAASYTEQNRPGRTPLLVRERQNLAEIRLDFVLSKLSLDDHVATEFATLQELAKAKQPVTLVLATRTLGLYRITELSASEIEHTPFGQVARLDVSMTLKLASDAAVVVGPVKPKRR